MLKSATVLAVATVIAAPLAAPLSARAADAPRDDAQVLVHVSYGDLDVHAPAGARALMNRIARAASSACGGWPDSLIHDDHVRFDRCRTEAYGRAVTQLDPQIITAVSDDNGPAPIVRLAAR